MKADNGFQDNYSVVVASGTPLEPGSQDDEGSQLIAFRVSKGFQLALANNLMGL